MATLVSITNELISLIKTQYPRFKDPDRIKLDQEIENENLGYEDAILIRVLPMNTSINLTSGKIANYVFELVYYKKVYENKIGNVAAFADALDMFLLGYVHHASYWTHFDSVIDYFDSAVDNDIVIPEAYTGKLSGFTMTLTFIAYNS